tara:strand:- start:492 stop:659 length:168 start_codon:yes stop_codon:yes gene_type:complete
LQKRKVGKIFFLREKLKIDVNFSVESFHVNEILDQCIDWREFWRLFVVQKGFCFI